MAGRVEVEIRRVYDDPGPARGRTRVLVDRLWPRGVRKEDLAVDDWARDIAPSDGLRRWYGHDVERFEEFRRRYLEELRQAPAADAVSRVLSAAGRGRLVLLTATRDVEHSGAAVLATHLRRRRSRVTG